MTPHDVELTNIANTLATRPDLANDPRMQEAITRLDQAPDCACDPAVHKWLQIQAMDGNTL